MKLALGQINTTVADFEGTVRKVADAVSRAKGLKADLIAFPELTTTGYPPRDLVESEGFVEKNLKALQEIALLARGIAIVVGYVGRNERPGGKPLFNAAALCREGKIEGTYAKNLLPTYDVFDEGRYFEPGTKAGIWKVQKKIGISICEDSWNDKLFWEKRLYPRDPIEEQVNQGADFLLNISASPYSMGKNRFRREMLAALALRHGLPLFYVNLVGGNDELVFDGRSLAINDRGEVIAEGKSYEEDLLVVDLEEMKRMKPVPENPENDLESVFQTLVWGVRDYVRKCGFQKVVLGLSGGIDSSLTALIAAEAVGPKNVLGVLMPSPFSSEGSIRDAVALVKNLGIRFVTYPIDDIYNAYRKRLKHPIVSEYRPDRIHSVRANGANDPTIGNTDEGFGGRAGSSPDLADENIQARIRGNILMALSNRDGYLVLSTGNKSELAVGYCTLYGDMSGGLSVISDLPKTLVYEVARHCQKKRNLIPEPVFTKAPSAELRPNQTDQDSLPPYETLDAILKATIEERKSEEEVIRMGFDPAVVRDVIRRMKQNEYKRRQAAPGIKVTSKAFGIGRRYPIARKI